MGVFSTQFVPLISIWHHKYWKNKIVNFKKADFCKMLRILSSSKQLLSKKIFVRNLLFYTYLPSLCKEFFEMRHNLEHSSSHLLNIKPLLKSGLHMIFPFHLIILAPNLQTNLIKLLENQKTCKDRLVFILMSQITNCSL